MPLSFKIKNYESHNQIFGTGAFKNKYFILRHGESTANIAWRFHNTEEADLSSPATLTTKGEDQAKLAAEHFASLGIIPDDVLVISSTLRRAIQTADIFCTQLNIAQRSIDRRILERCCGEFENTLISKEIKVEMDRYDESDPFHKYKGMESPIEVTARATALLKELETRYEEKTIVLVTHYHTGSILMNACEGIFPGKDRELENAKLYPLLLADVIALGDTPSPPASTGMGFFTAEASKPTDVFFSPPCVI